MGCASCGASLDEGAKFCSQCGASTTKVCPRCDRELLITDRFCSQCGQRVSDSAIPAPDVVAERRVVSVLFVDLVGFTSYSEGRDPEEVRSLITDYFDLARDVIERFGGTIDKFIGDAVMAWWGATTSMEDDAERAVRAALELLDGVRSHGEQVGLADLTARAGVMTGEVSVSSGGNERGLLLGDLVNSTSRLQTIAEPGTVYVSERTGALVAEAIELGPFSSHPVKGREDPLVAAPVRRVLGERGGRNRSEVIEPAFVGRTSELRLLKDTLTAAGREGRAKLVSLVGQAGIGKSRLVWEFRKYVDGLVEDVFWHEGRSPAYGEGLSLWALGEMIRQRARIQETHGDDATLQRLTDCVDTYIDAPEDRPWIRDRLATLLGVGDSQAGERSELFAAARALFEGVSRRGTTVLVFEDLQWADPSQLEFIEELPTWSQNHPIMVVTLTRPDLLDRRPDWGSGRQGFASIYLGPLADDEMAELISGSVPGIPAVALERIVSGSGGVPLFAVEMVRMLLSDGRLVADSGAVTMTDELTDVDVPPTVHAIVAARLDRLPAGERDVVRDAAVAGYSFTIEAVAALRDESIDKIEEWLSGLVRHEILELVRDPRSPERGQYRWLQSVLREVAYGRIARTDRRDLHLRVARYFRDLGDPELAPIATAHYVSAAEFAGASGPDLEAELAASVLAAIDRARTIHAHEQVLSLVATALPVVSGPIEVDLGDAAAQAAVKLSMNDTAEEYGEAVMRLAEASGDPATLHRAMALAGYVANETRRSQRGVAVLEPHIEAYPDLMSDPYLAQAGVSLARARLLTGEAHRAAELADAALAAVEHYRLMEPIADAMITRGTALADTGRPYQAMALLRGALDVCRTHDLVATRLRALINIGYASSDMVESMTVTQEAFEEAKRVGDRGHATFVAGNLVDAHIYRLELAPAREVLDDPVLADEPTARLQRLCTMTIIALLEGDDERATRLVGDQEDLASSVTDPQALIAVERTQALVKALAGDHLAAFEIGKRLFSETPFARFLSFDVALTGGSMEPSPEVVAELTEMAGSMQAGSLTSPMIDWAHALKALVEGSTDEAVEITDRTLAHLADDGSRWMEFRVALSLARGLPRDHPSRAAYAERARRVARDVGADGLLAWADGTLAPV